MHSEQKVLTRFFSFNNCYKCSEVNHSLSVVQESNSPDSGLQSLILAVLREILQTCQLKEEKQTGCYVYSI